MYGRILKRMRELVRRGRYVMTTHADDEADEDGLSLLDIESAILTGSIMERQRIVKLSRRSTLSTARPLMAMASLSLQSSG